MTDKPPPQADYNALAKRYLDLWQDQVAKLSRDPGQLGQAAQSWSQMASAMMQNPAKPQPGTSHDPNASKPSAPGGAAPAAAAHGDGGVDLANLLSRIGQLEERVRVLESAKPAPANPQRRRRKKSGDVPG